MSSSEPTRFDRAAQLVRTPAAALEAFEKIWTESGSIFPLDERREAARHVLWHNGEPDGLIPGGFTQSLLNTWSRGDFMNQHRLRSGFPCLGAAVDIAQESGSAALREWAELPEVDNG